MMLLVLSLVGFVLLITIFAIALIWDYTHGIFSFSRADNSNENAAPHDSFSYELERHGSPSTLEHPTT